MDNQVKLVTELNLQVAKSPPKVLQFWPNSRCYCSSFQKEKKVHVHCPFATNDEMQFLNSEEWVRSAA
jgi:hypothetical protein